MMWYVNKRCYNDPRVKFNITTVVVRLVKWEENTDFAVLTNSNSEYYVKFSRRRQILLRTILLW